MSFARFRFRTKEECWKPSGKRIFRCTTGPGASGAERGLTGSTSTPPPLQDRKPSYWSDTPYFVQGTRVELTAVPTYADDSFVGWLRDAHGTDPSISIVMDGPKEVGARFTDLPILQPGAPESGNLSRVRGFWIYVPFAAAELSVDVELDDSATDAILAVNQESKIWVDDRGRIEDADFQAPVSDGSARIAISRETSPSIKAGPYFIRVVAADDAPAAGTLTATVASGIPIRASPRAFTFVAPEGNNPATQTFELRNMGDRRRSYLIHADRSWLRVEPQEATLGAGETVEVSVMASSTGLPMDIHQAKLSIVDAEGMYEQGTGVLVEGDVFDIGSVVFSEGVSLPVTFALISRD